jgi:membrane protease YdiL (CAAX protease family)
MQYYIKRILTMSYESRQLSVVKPLPIPVSAPLFDIRSKRANISLLTETTVVTIIAIMAVRISGISSIIKANWFVVPGTLIAAALVPTMITRRDFVGIGFNKSQIRHSLLLLGWACLATFPPMALGLWLMRCWGFELPLRTFMPPAQGWFCWLFYQFMYISVAEEVFFRGYIQDNILRFTGAKTQERQRLLQWISIVISAGCFTAAHIIVQGKIISILIFLPGLVLGWLFVRTRSLLAPILFHGLANTIYLCAIGALV